MPYISSRNVPFNQEQEVEMSYGYPRKKRTRKKGQRGRGNRKRSKAKLKAKSWVDFDKNTRAVDLACLRKHSRFDKYFGPDRLKAPRKTYSKGELLQKIHHLRDGAGLERQLCLGRCLRHEYRKDAVPACQD